MKDRCMDEAYGGLFIPIKVLYDIKSPPGSLPLDLPGDGK